MASPKVVYNKEMLLRVCDIKNRAQKILSLYNHQKRIIPMPVQFLQSFIVRKASPDKLGVVTFNCYPIVREYPYLYQFIQDEPLCYYYKKVEDLHQFLEEVEMYFYNIDDLFRELDEQLFPTLAAIRKKMAGEVQEGRSPESMRLLKRFFKR